MASKVSFSSDSSSSIERSFGKMDLLAMKNLRNQEQSELIDISTTSDETSESSTSIASLEESKLKFEGKKPLVLELHDITRNKPAAPTPVPASAPAPAPAPATTLVSDVRKKLRKKKKKIKEAKKQESSSSRSDASLCHRSANKKEEFYDARESYHAIPPEQHTSPVALKSIVSPTLKESPFHSERVPSPGLVIRGSTEKPGILKKSPVTKRDSPHSSVAVTAALPDTLAIGSGSEQVETVKKAAVAKTQRAKTPTKTAITKPTEP
ncbi:hypothetical protein O0L34_g16427 [Tuta absoluta]|nr:hypothetical protein O0L34_g16427 [Tuta absoluta]